MSMSVAFGGAAANLKAQQGDQVGYWTLDPSTGTYAFTPQDPSAAAMVPQSFMQLTDAAAPASPSMNLLPLAALVGGAFLALSRLGPRRNPFRAYPGPPPSHALFGRLVGRFWWGADPPAEVVEAREARKHHKQGESLEKQIDAELAHGRELRKKLDEHRDQVPNLRDYGLDKRDEFERDVAAHNREQQRLNDEYQESGRKRYALIARRQEQQKAAETPEQKHVAELRQELRTLETLAPKMSEGAISPTQMNRMSKRQRAKYDRDMARRWQVEDELKELAKPPEQREAERQARETKAAEKARSDRLAQVESEIAFRESVHHRGIGGTVKRNKEIYADLLAERERLGGAPAPKWTPADAPPAGMSRTEFEKRLAPRPIGNGYAVRQDVAGSGWTLIYPSGETRTGFATRLEAERRAEQHRIVTAPATTSAGAPMDVSGADQYRITMSERRRYGSPVQVPVTYDRVGPNQWVQTVRNQRKAGTLSDGMVAYQVDLARSEGRLVGTPAATAPAPTPAAHQETPAEWRARMERRQEERRAATPAELKVREKWVPYVDSEAPGVRRTGPDLESPEMQAIEHHEGLAGALEWASRVKWGAMRLELGKAAYKSKEAEDELADFRKQAEALGYRVEHAHYGAGDRTWRFRVEKASPAAAAPAATAPPDSAAKRQYEAGWKASERFGSSEGTGPTPLERADDRGAPPAWYHGYEDHASDRQKWATFESRSGELVHLPRDNPRRVWPRFPGRRWRKVA